MSFFENMRSAIDGGSGGGFGNLLGDKTSARLAGIGSALTALGRRQPVDLSPYRNEIASIEDRDRFASQMQAGGFMDKLTPEQKQILANMPPAAARQVIARLAFAQTEPVKGVEIDGALVNPITGETIREAAPKTPDPVKGINIDGALVNPITGAVIREAALKPGYRQLSPDEIEMRGLDKSKAYQIGPDNKVSQIGGGGITINNGTESSVFGKAEAGTAWVFDENGDHVMETFNGYQRPVRVPLSGSTSEGRALEEKRLTENKNTAAVNFVNDINAALAHPSLDSAVGRFGAANRALGVLADAGTKEAFTIVDKLKGNTFLDAYNGIKGAGPITDLEGQAASAAQNRINEALEPKEYRAALMEAKALIQERIAKVAADRGETPDAGPAPAAPRAGDVVDGWRFKGGDPGNPDSWERAL